MVLKTNFERSDENSQDPLNENFTEIEKLFGIPFVATPVYSGVSFSSGRNLVVLRENNGFQYLDIAMLINLPANTPEGTTLANINTNLVSSFVVKPASALGAQNITCRAEFGTDGNIKMWGHASTSGGYHFNCSVLVGEI